MKPYRRLVLFLLVLLLPISAYAGLFGIFRNDQPTSDLPLEKNLTNMNLLMASAAPASNSTLHLPKIEDDALVAAAGLFGNEAESEIHRPSSQEISIYVVRDGDTLSQIAKMFGVSVNTIKWGNNLSSNILKEGQTLVILPISGVKHTVVGGDTVKSLAKKYNGNVEEILSFNNLKESESLALGSIVIIPDGEVAAPPTSSVNASVKAVSSGLKEYKGYYMRPVVGGVKTQGIHGYNAIDIGAPVGTPVLAAADGEVIISRSGGWNGGYGTYVVIRHANGTQTLYAHHSSNVVSVGDTVKQGDIIGYVGATGKATGPHLHFEIRGAKNPF